jgi:hypothetical protein
VAQARRKLLSSDPVGRAVASDAVGTQVWLVREEPKSLSHALTLSHI